MFVIKFVGIDVHFALGIFFFFQHSDIQDIHKSKSFTRLLSQVLDKLKTQRLDETFMYTSFIFFLFFFLFLCTTNLQFFYIFFFQNHFQHFQLYQRDRENATSFGEYLFFFYLSFSNISKVLIHFFFAFFFVSIYLKVDDKDRKIRKQFFFI